MLKARMLGWCREKWSGTAKAHQCEVRWGEVGWMKSTEVERKSQHLANGNGPELPKKRPGKCGRRKSKALGSFLLCEEELKSSPKGRIYINADTVLLGVTVSSVSLTASSVSLYSGPGLSEAICRAHHGSSVWAGRVSPHRAS